MKIIRMLIILSITLFMSYSIITDYSPISKSLGLTYFSYSKNAVGFNFTPALTYENKTWEYEIGHVPVFLDDVKEIFAFLFKKKSFTYGGNINITHPLSLYLNKDLGDINSLFSKGISSGTLNYFDVELTLGISHKISVFNAGYSLIFGFSKFHDYYGFNLNSIISFAYILDVYPLDKFPLTIALSYNQSLLNSEESGFGNSIFGNDFSVTGAGNMNFIPIKTIFSAAISYDYNNSVPIYDSKTGTYELFNPAYLSVGLSVQNESIHNLFLSLSLSGGPLHGISFNSGVSYKLVIQKSIFGINYTFSQKFSDKFKDNKNLFSISFSKNLNKFVYISGVFLKISDDLNYFNTLSSDFKNINNLQTKSIKNNFKVYVSKIKTLNASTTPISLLKNVNYIIKNKFSESRTFSVVNKNEELKILPILTLVGEILKLNIKLKKNNKLLLEEVFDSEYKVKSDEQSKVDNIRYYIKNGKIIFIKNNGSKSGNEKSINEMIQKAENFITSYIEKNYLTKTEIYSQYASTVIKINNIPIGLTEKNKPLIVYLKNDKYKISAKPPGREEKTIKKNIKKSEKIYFTFNKDKFYTDLKLKVLNYQGKAEYKIGRIKGKFRNTSRIKNIYSKDNNLYIKTKSLKFNVPLKIRSRKIYKYNFLVNSKINFKRYSKYLKKLISDDSKIFYKRNLLEINGVTKDFKWTGNGIISLPFFVENFSLEFNITKQGKGEFIFLLIGDKLKKLEIGFNGKDIYAFSNFKKKIKKTKLKGKKINNNNVKIKIISKGGQVQVFQNNKLFYKGDFINKGNIEFSFLTDSNKKGDVIKYLVKNLIYKNL